MLIAVVLSLNPIITFHILAHHGLPAQRAVKAGQVAAQCPALPGALPDLHHAGHWQYELSY